MPYSAKTHQIFPTTVFESAAAECVPLNVPAWRGAQI